VGSALGVGSTQLPVGPLTAEGVRRGNLLSCHSTGSVRRPMESSASEQLSLPFRIETQVNPIADEVSAITAVVRPILEGTLYALKAEIVAEVGGFANLSLKMLSRVYRRGDGDCGLCFEYAVHEALNRGEPSVLERVATAMTICRVPGEHPASILFGAEKAGTRQIIETANDLLTARSSLLYGTQGRPVMLQRHLRTLAEAFKRQDAREALPHSISGLWKADLFLGNADADKWVGTSVKINPAHLTGERGLRIGVVPTRQGRSDSVTKDDSKNLVVCPLPHDGEFMEIFYRGWGIVQQFIAADATLPREVNLPLPVDRQVARALADRRDFPVVDVIEALGPLAQPELLATSQHAASLKASGVVGTGAVLAPTAMQTQFWPAGSQ
jgi:hypothetical protein